MPPVRPAISYLNDRQGRSVAYSVIGSGPSLVCDTGFVSHLEAQWEFRPYRRFFEALARSRAVVRYDLPGLGLGDPSGRVVDFEDDVAVLEDLVTGLDLPRFDLFGASQAAPVMVAYAARHPDRVNRLILFGGYARGSELSPPPMQAALLHLIEAHWGVASKTLADIFMRGADETAQQAWAAVTRVAATPEAAVRRMSECFRTDVSALLPAVAAPTLVIHRRDDKNVAFQHGRELAAGIPGANFVALEGEAHIWYVGDMESVLAPILAFLGDKRRRPRSRVDLSPREREVAALITRGLSNGEIAVRLGISERTAEAHAEHIRDKLGFHSRSQIAAWMAARRAGELESPAR